MVTVGIGDTFQPGLFAEPQRPYKALMSVHLDGRQTIHLCCHVVRGEGIPASMPTVKPGDPVRFAGARGDRGYVVTKMELRVEQDSEADLGHRVEGCLDLVDILSVEKDRDLEENRTTLIRGAAKDLGEHQ